MCRIFCKVLTLIFGMASLALAVAGTLLPSFTSETTPQANSTEVPYTKAKIGLWHKEEFLIGGSNPVKVVLRTEYFDCDDGKIRIQAAEGVAIVTCVLTLANFIMSIINFCNGRLMKYPMAIYFLLAAGGAATVFGLMLNWYSDGWCNRALKNELGAEWAYGAGWILMVVSCGCSFLGFVTSLSTC